MTEPTNPHSPTTKLLNAIKEAAAQQGKDVQIGVKELGHVTVIETNIPTGVEKDFATKENVPVALTFHISSLVGITTYTGNAVKAVRPMSGSSNPQLDAAIATAKNAIARLPKSTP